MREEPEAIRPGPRDLFFGFMAIALSGFGGVLPFARRTIVDQRRWLTNRDFTEFLSLALMLPGPNIVNLAILVGQRAAGWRGAVAAALGLLIAPFFLVIGLGMVYVRTGDIPASHGVFAGIAAAAAGLVISTMGRLLVPMLRRRPIEASPFVVAGFLAVGLLRLPLITAMLLLAPLSLFVAWKRP